MSEAAKTTSALSAGSQIDRYIIDSELGAGGFARVYRATHLHTRRAVALKVLDERFATNAEVRERFRREAEAGTSIRSEYVVEVFDWAYDGEGRSFMAMELCEGESLAELIDREGPLPLDRALKICVEILRGLEAAHAKGVIHRDVKPSNVFLVRAGLGKESVKILDFGISKQEESEMSTLTSTGQVIGSPGYMAPEQIKEAGQTDARTDLYAVGVLLFQMLSGQRPFDAKTYESYVIQVSTTLPPSLRDLAPACPAELVDLVASALSPNPADRPQSAREFASYLEDPGSVGSMLAETVNLGSSVTSAQPREAASTASRGRRFAGTRNYWLAAALAGAIALAGLAATRWSRQDKSDKQGAVAIAGKPSGPSPTAVAPIAQAPALRYETSSSSTYLSMTIVKVSREHWTIAVDGQDRVVDLHPMEPSSVVSWLDDEDNQWLLQRGESLQFSGPGNPRSYSLPLERIVEE